MIQLLITIALVALTVPGFVLVIRILPVVAREVEAGRKPWACDYCMCFWSTGFWTIVHALWFWDWHLMLACGPAYTLSLVLLEYMQRPPPGSGPPPVFDIQEPTEP